MIGQDLLLLHCPKGFDLLQKFRFLSTNNHGILQDNLWKILSVSTIGGLQEFSKHIWCGHISYQCKTGAHEISWDLQPLDGTHRPGQSLGWKNPSWWNMALQIELESKQCGPMLLKSSSSSSSSIIPCFCTWLNTTLVTDLNTKHNSTITIVAALSCFISMCCCFSLSCWAPIYCSIFFEGLTAQPKHFHLQIEMFASYPPGSSAFWDTMR